MNRFIQFDFDGVFGNNILPYLKDDPWFRQAAEDRIVSELTELKNKMDLFDNERLRLNREIASLLARHPRVLAQPPSRERAKTLAELRDKAYRLKKSLTDAYLSFLRRSYRRYLPIEAGLEGQDRVIQEMRGNLANRFESITKPDVKKCLDIIDQLIERYHSANS
jgi:hypothetical protein